LEITGIWTTKKEPPQTPLTRHAFNIIGDSDPIQVLTKEVFSIIFLLQTIPNHQSSIISINEKGCPLF